jgi:hypothetical protein
MPPTSAQPPSIPEVATQVPVQRPRPTAIVPTSRAEAEAAARLQGQMRLEQQQAQQRAETEAATVLERGLKVPVSLRDDVDHTYDRISRIHQ